MTSSWCLVNRRRMQDAWKISNFGDPENALGGWEDHYIIDGANRECHPEFEAVPIGNPYGFMVCRRRKHMAPSTPNGHKKLRSLDVPADPIDPSQFNGYHKYSADLYRPWMREQIQITDPYNYYDRTTPNEPLLHQRDYLARDIKYNGTGIHPIRTPGPRKYFEYGDSFTPLPPYKYDVTQLHQRYPIWKEEQIYHGLPQQSADYLDRVYNDAVPVSTW